jgi:hypothetical protein
MQDVILDSISFTAESPEKAAIKIKKILEILEAEEQYSYFQYETGEGLIEYKIFYYTPEKPIMIQKVGTRVVQKII